MDANLKVKYLTSRADEFPANEERPALFPAEETGGKSVDWVAILEA